VFLASDWNGKKHLMAIDAWRREMWSMAAPNEGERLMLGNHQGTDVLLVGDTLVAQSSLQAFEAKTGRVLSAAYTSNGSAGADWTLLRGGFDKSLVVAQRIWDTVAQTYVLQACRLDSSVAPWRFDCVDSNPLPIEGSTDRILVRQTSQGTRVFVGSQDRHWCALGWTEGGFGSGCIEEDSGPGAVGLTWKIPHLLGHRHFWGYFAGSKLQSFSLDTGLLGAIVDAQPLLVDANDVLVAINTDNRFQRFSASGASLSEGSEEAWTRPEGIALMEGGDMVFLSIERHVSCLSSSLRSCWKETRAEGSSSSQFLGVLPLSSTRSVVVFSQWLFGLSVVGFLIDSPGLKKDTPWPIWGQDPCRTFNASVPVGNCWDGPSF
jgi:hypothetical protein